MVFRSVERCRSTHGLSSREGGTACGIKEKVGIYPQKLEALWSLLLVLSGEIFASPSLHAELGLPGASKAGRMGYFSATSGIGPSHFEKVADNHIYLVQIKTTIHLKEMIRKQMIWAGHQPMIQVFTLVRFGRRESCFICVWILKKV